MLKWTSLQVCCWNGGVKCHKLQIHVFIVENALKAIQSQPECLTNELVNVSTHATNLQNTVLKHNY